jgi:hypothetical protein
MNQDAGLESDVADVLPSLAPAAQLEALASLKAYIKKLPLSRRPLVKVSVCLCVVLAASQEKQLWHLCSHVQQVRLHDMHFRPIVRVDE